MTGQDLSYPLAFSAGLLSFLSPCVLPLVPIYLGYLTGAGAGNQQLSTEQSRAFTLAHGLAFVVGFSLIFVALGIFVGSLGALLIRPWVELPLPGGAQLPIGFLQVGALLLLVMGLHLLGVVRIPLLYMEKRLEVQRAADPNLLSSLLIGATFGAGWTPCVGPVLGGILSLAALQGSVLQSGSLLAVYSAGLALPFLLFAFGLGQASRAIRRLGPYLRYVEMASGVLLIFVALLIFTNQFTQLNSFFIQFTPEWLLERL